MPDRLPRHDPSGGWPAARGVRSRRAMKEIKRTRRRGRLLLSATAGMAVLATSAGCGTDPAQAPGSCDAGPGFECGPLGTIIPLGGGPNGISVFDAGQVFGVVPMFTDAGD